MLSRGGVLGRSALSGDGYGLGIMGGFQELDEMRADIAAAYADDIFNQVAAERRQKHLEEFFYFHHVNKSSATACSCFQSPIAGGCLQDSRRVSLFLAEFLAC